MEIMTVRASAEQETTSLQTEVNDLRSLLFELQNNQTIFEELQRRIEKLMETNTTLQREIMMVRVSAEQETNSLQMEVNELRSLLLELQNNQTVIEELQKQIEEILEINTTLQREIMMVCRTRNCQLTNSVK